MRIVKPIEAIISKRYKRFLADVLLPDGQLTTVHVPNTGRMTTCWEPGWKCILSKSDNANRKYQYTLELTNNGNTWIAVNTNIANALAYEFISEGKIQSLKSYNSILREQKYGRNSRIDILLEKDERKCYIEVKNTTLLRGETAYFPDAPSPRAIKHLEELTEIVAQGHRAVMLFMVSRSDAKYMSPAHFVDADYAVKLAEAKEKGVELIAVSCNIVRESLSYGGELEIIL